MKPFVVEPQWGELRVVVFYNMVRVDELKLTPCVVGGHEFMVRHFANVWGDLRNYLGQIEFVPGRLYTWKGHVCLHNGTCLKAEGSWYSMEWFIPHFDLGDSDAERTEQEEVAESGEGPGA